MRFFASDFFRKSSSPQSLENNTQIISNFSENLQVKVHQQCQRQRQQNCCRHQWHRRQICHRYQQHRRQILPLAPLVLLIPVANLPPVSTIPAANLPPVSTAPVANCHRYQQHRWQTMGTISECWQFKMNLKKKFIFMLTLLPKGVQKKKWKLFWLMFFPFANGVKNTGGATGAANIPADFRKNLKRP